MNKQVSTFIDQLTNYDWIDSYVELQPDWEFDWSKDKNTAPKGLMVTMLVAFCDSGLIDESTMLKLIDERVEIEIDPDYLMTIDELKQKYGKPDTPDVDTIEEVNNPEQG